MLTINDRMNYFKSAFCMLTVEEKMKYFKKDCIARGLSDDTCKEYPAAVEYFLIYIGNPPVNYNDEYIDCKPYLEHFKIHLSERGLSYSRIKYIFTAINNW